MMNKKASITITFLVISLLVVASSLIITVNKIQKDYNKNNAIELDSEFIQSDFSGLGSLSNKDFDSSLNSFFGGGGSSKKSSSSSSNNPNEENLLEPYEKNYENFQEIEIGDKTVFFQQRIIGNAIVEKDFKVYQFDKESGEFVKKIINWQNDLPEYLPPRISKEQAESMVEGEIRFSKLYIISPDSDVFPIKPTPKNPCWVVASINEYSNMIITIIDAVTGEILGYGIPPPYNAFSLTGPQYTGCSGAWDRWSNNAEYWFNEMHYNTETATWPNESQVQSHIQSNETVLFYETAHGSSFCFASGCSGGLYESTCASEVETWITGYRKMPFTFLATCDGMCNTGSGTLSNAFRKGSDEDTATIGYCGMSGSACSECWGNSVQWQDKLFEYLKGGAYTVKQAFDEANSIYSSCVNCMRFEGDENLKLVSCDEDWGENYCCDWGGNTYTCKNTTCHNLAGVSFTKPYSEIPLDKCGESYCEAWGDNYCEDGHVKHNRTCYNAGCSEGACYNDEYEEEEIVETCEYGCDDVECMYPDLFVEDLSISQTGTNIWLMFKIKNIGNAVANQFYWMVDTDSGEENQTHGPYSLSPEKALFDYFSLNYSSPGTYNPTVIVDFDNLINESDEGNNNESIFVSVL